MQDPTSMQDPLNFRKTAAVFSCRRFAMESLPQARAVQSSSGCGLLLLIDDMGLYHSNSSNLVELS